MSEQQYKAIGWGILVILAAIALYMCMNQNGIAGYLIRFSEQATGHQLTQIAWLITFAVFCLPGWMVKNYFEGLAWNAHVAKLPPPDAQSSAKRSKYVKAPEAPPAPKPVKLENVAKDQQEFIATCPGCGNLFSANKKQIGPTRCPSCGEVVPIA